MSETKFKPTLPSTLKALTGKYVLLNLKDSITSVEGLLIGEDLWQDLRKSRLYVIVEKQGNRKTLAFETIRDWQEEPIVCPKCESGISISFDKDSGDRYYCKNCNGYFKQPKKAPTKEKNEASA